MRRADHRCCLSGIGSVRMPACIVQKQKETLMGKKDWLRRSDDDVSCAGRSLVEIMEEELDDVMTQLMENVYDEDEAEDAANLNLLRGKAQGISTCLAIIQNPYAPSIDGIKADAVRRYEARKRMTSEAH